MHRLPVLHEEELTPASRRESAPRSRDIGNGALVLYERPVCLQYPQASAPPAAPDPTATPGAQLSAKGDCPPCRVPPKRRKSHFESDQEFFVFLRLAQKPPSPSILSPGFFDSYALYYIIQYLPCLCKRIRSFFVFFSKKPASPFSKAKKFGIIKGECCKAEGLSCF